MLEERILPAAVRVAVEWAYGLRIAEVRSIRSIWRLTTSDGAYCLKPIRIDPAGLPFLVGLHDYLQSRAPGLAPRIRRTLDGRDHLEVRGCLYQVQDCLSGREADYLNLEDLETVAASLAGFHRAAAGFKYRGYGSGRIYYGMWPFVMRRRMLDLDRFFGVAGKQDSEFCRAYLDLWPSYRRQAARALYLLPRAGYGSLTAEARRARQVCHHDLAHHNILLSVERTSFVDLDYAVADSVLHDLINLLKHVTRLYIWDPVPAYTVIERYWTEGNIDWRQTAVIGVMLLWPEDFWQIGRQYFDERQPWPEDEFIAVLRRKCGFTRERRRFLDEFWRRYRLSGAFGDRPASSG